MGIERTVRTVRGSALWTSVAALVVLALIAIAVGLFAARLAQTPVERAVSGLNRDIDTFRLTLESWQTELEKDEFISEEREAFLSDMEEFAIKLDSHKEQLQVVVQ